jgi:hypothetical protein
LTKCLVSFRSVLALYVRMQNPKVYDAKGKTPAKDKISEAKKQGHDGVVFKNIADPSIPALSETLIPPTPTQGKFVMLPTEQL